MCLGVAGILGFVNVVERAKIGKFDRRRVGRELVRVLWFVGCHGTVLIRLAKHLRRRSFADADAAEPALANGDEVSPLGIRMQRRTRVHVSAEHLHLMDLVFNRKIEMGGPRFHAQSPIAFP